MMSEYYDHYHRWEPLAEFHFIIDVEEDDDEYDANYVYCLCSRAFIRDGVRTYYAERKDNEEGSESDAEVQSETGSREWDESHVQFSLETEQLYQHEGKIEKDEASCYCSASHTENCCSTDEHDAAPVHTTNINGIQPSDSGADLTYPDFHSDHHEKSEHMNQDYPAVKADFTETNEDYLFEDTWEKFWAVHGERIIWASWIKKYSDFINPSYLGENNDLVMDEHNIPKQHSADAIYELDQTDSMLKSQEDIRERKFSYDSKVNPYKKVNKINVKIDANTFVGNDNTFVPIGRRRSCSEHLGMVSPRTIAGTDSMTNVTKMTSSTYDVTSSHVTSESTPTEQSVSSSPTEDLSNDETRIANIDNILEEPSESMDGDQYWQFLWKKHFGEQYALHYANYLESNTQSKTPPINIEIAPQYPILQEVAANVECENSEGNSLEMPSVIEVQTQVDELKIKDKEKRTRAKKKKTTTKYLGSVGYLLQNLLKDESLLKDLQAQENEKKDELADAGEQCNDTKEPVPQDGNEKTENNDNIGNNEQSVNINSIKMYSCNDDDDEDPPDDKPGVLKRSHEIEEYLEEEEADKIKSTFQIMGFCIDQDSMPKGQMVYRKRNARLRPPRTKKMGVPRKTYFDDDGNPIQDSDQEKNIQEPEDESIAEMQSNDNPEPQINTNKVETEIAYNNTETSNTQTTNTETSNTQTTNTQTTNTQTSNTQNTNTQTTNTQTSNTQNTNTQTTNTQNTNTETTDTETNTASTYDYDVQNKPDSSDDTENALFEASNVPFPDLEASFSDVLNENEEQKVEAKPSSITKRKRRQKRYKVDDDEVGVSEMPAELIDDPKMKKYWKKRHSLFHRFDEGIKLDRESWFSVTPESVAWHIAKKYSYDVVLDAFCGAGGNTIQFAKINKKVIAIDIDPEKIEMARHNATVYGVVDKIEFIVGDFFELAPTLQADMVFLSPPWGGPKYSENVHYDIESMLEPRPASELMATARTINHNVALYLPRNSRTDQILSLAREAGGSVEVEQSYLDRRFVAITAYFY